MKTLTVRENTRGRKATVHAQATYQTESGSWVAEVDGAEMGDACRVLCNGIKDCSCENLHVEADEDDDGKEYTVVPK